MIWLIGYPLMLRMLSGCIVEDGFLRGTRERGLGGCCESDSVPVEDYM